jgi:hypothetical protein
MATEANTNTAAYFKELIDTLRAEVRDLQAKLSDKADRTKEPKLDVAKPPVFNGGANGTTVQTFLTQARARLRYHATLDTEEEKVHYVAGFLQGDAANWFEPTLRDQLQNAHDERDDETHNIFGNFSTFARRLTETFGNPDEKRTAERRLGQLKQKGSASVYSAEFQQIAAKQPCFCLVYFFVCGSASVLIIG